MVIRNEREASAPFGSRERPSMHHMQAHGTPQ